MNAPLDGLHEKCLSARNEVRAGFDLARAAVLAWEMAECPPAPSRRLRPLSVWLDDQTAVPVSVPFREVWDADDPLLRPRRWLRQ